uniref:Uroporphyrinogen decarboxylase n=1 Tax=Thermorudis peleae TaxID=1382356 RepID=A0A831TLE1_9BACT
MEDSRFLLACQRKPVDATPIWLMRQAGRYLPEYRAVRARASLLEICSQAELVAEVTLQPVRRLGVDAAIIFADILLPLVSMGVRLEFAAGEGPVIHDPVRAPQAIERLRRPESEEIAPAIYEAIRLVRRELGGKVPVIGFAGAPFTVASYLIEGGSSRHYSETKRLMYGQPHAWFTLMDTLTDVTTRYLRGQVMAGAQAVQLFDSWAGALSPLDYRERVLPWVRRIVDELRPLGVPVIIFGTGTAGFLSTLAESGADVIGVDWRIRLDDARAAIGFDRAIQGNLDPAVLFAPRDEIARQVQAVLGQAGGRPGHIFNLGHGVLPETPVDNARYLVELVHELTSAPSPAGSSQARVVEDEASGERRESR